MREIPRKHLPPESGKLCKFVHGKRRRRAVRLNIMKKTLVFFLMQTILLPCVRKKFAPYSREKNFRNGMNRHGKNVPSGIHHEFAKFRNIARNHPVGGARKIHVKQLQLKMNSNEEDVPGKKRFICSEGRTQICTAFSERQGVLVIAHERFRVRRGFRNQQKTIQRGIRPSVRGGTSG